MRSLAIALIALSLAACDSGAPTIPSPESLMKK
jgi:hypothetical protein